MTIDNSDINHDCNDFEFDLGQTVSLLWHPGEGIVSARLDAIGADPLYFVKYVVDGVLHEAWVQDDQIDTVDNLRN